MEGETQMPSNELPEVPVRETGGSSNAPEMPTPDFQEEVAAKQKEKDEAEMQAAREEIERAHGPQTPPKVESQFAEERVGTSTEQEQTQPERENPNEPKVEESRFNPNYESNDFYERLGVPRDSSLKDIAGAFRDAAFKTHPDRGGDAEKFKAAKEAFDTLNNPDKKAQYDFSNPRQEEGPRDEQPRPEQKQPEDASNPKSPEAEAPGQEASDKTFSQKARETAEHVGRAAKRGAKAFSETYAKQEVKRKAEEAEEKARKKAEKEKARAAEQEKLRKEVEAAKAKKEAEKQKKSEQAQKEKEKREKVREAERTKQERRNERREKSAGRRRAERRGERRAEATAEKIPNPWENWGEQSRASEKYFAENRLGSESKKYINESLQNEIKDVKDGLAQKWFDENKYKLEARGIPINGLSGEAMVRLAIDPATGEFSKETLDDLEKNKDLYGADLSKIENAKALGTEFGKDKVSPESQFLMLNHLEKRTMDLYDQIAKLESLGGQENRAKAAELQKEMDNLFIARKELAQIATGRDLTKETLARVAERLGHDSKEDYIKDKTLISQAELMVKVGKMNELAENEFANLSPKEKKGYKDESDFIKKWEAKGKKLGLSQDQLYALSAAGYKTSGTRKTGFLFFGRGVELSKIDGTKTKMNRKEFYNNIVKQAEYGYKAEVSADGQKELGRRWDQEETGALISELTVSMEESVGGTEAAYERLKQNLIEEYKKNPVREKSAKEQAAQDKEFGAEREEKADILGFLEDAMKGEGKFANLTGDLDKDKKILRNISDDYGMGLSPKSFKRLDAGAYGRAAKNRGGLISLFIELMIKNPLNKFTSTAA